MIQENYYNNTHFLICCAYIVLHLLYVYVNGKPISD